MTLFVIIGVATLGKLGGSALAAKLTGLNWRESMQLGALMNTRGLMELIALNIGYDMGILSQRIFTMLVIMALVTTIMTGPLLVLLDTSRQRRNSLAPQPIFSGS
jgi:Kef-type K+ transport system membrane component KefB